MIFIKSFSYGALSPSEATSKNYNHQITSSVFKTGFISNSSSNIDKIIFISIMANFWPIQFRVPALSVVFVWILRKLIFVPPRYRLNQVKRFLNGINENGCRVFDEDSFVSSRNRAGLKSNGFSKFSSSVWINSVWLNIILFDGFDSKFSGRTRNQTLTLILKFY